MLNKNILVEKFFEHTKASEKYVLCKFKYDKFYIYLIPYYYRRTGLFLEKELINKYLNGIYDELNPKNIKEWENKQNKYWLSMPNSKITKPIFDSLLGSNFVCNRCSLPKNTNLQRRIQAIKEFGYTLSTITNNCKKCNTNTTHHQLLYLKRFGDGKSEYETISLNLKKKIIKKLENFDSYENNYHSSSLLPDHKFPEIRWDKTVKVNNENINDENIKNKFQLLNNQRNQQKREVCRKCFQTNKRGLIYGINFFYKGTIEWDEKIPKIGKKAEEGCVGCGWYDIKKWRDSINIKIK